MQFIQTRPLAQEGGGGTHNPTCFEQVLKILRAGEDSDRRFLNTAFILSCSDIHASDESKRVLAISSLPGTIRMVSVASS